MVKTAPATSTGDGSNFICVPGQRLCAVTEYTVGGEGTYEKLGYLHASLSGVVRIRKRKKVSVCCWNCDLKKCKKKFFFSQNNHISVASFGSKTVVPVMGDVVTAKITVINQRFAKCVIICIGKTCLNRPYR